MYLVGLGLALLNYMKGESRSRVWGMGVISAKIRHENFLVNWMVILVVG